MSAVPFAYRAAVQAIRSSVPILAIGSEKLRRGVRGRRCAHEELASWGELRRDPRRLAAWFHAPSVGEALQAGAVVGALTARRSDLQVAFTHFSPSAEGMAARVGASVTTYLPWDQPRSMRRALDGVRPDLLVFTKTEVWPVLVHEARRRGIPTAMVAATVPADAGRMRWLARSLMRETWASLDMVCACTEEDAARLVSLGVSPDRVQVTGDPGVDAAAARAELIDPRSSVLAPFFADRRPSVIAGSTWPSDELVLLPAITDVRRDVPGLRLIIAPHEPTSARVRDIMEWLSASGWRGRILADVEASHSVVGVDAVVVERVGVLAHLYAAADVAYVGGGFGRKGLHSVLEPAAAAVPVVIGPRHGRALAASALASLGALAVAQDQAGLRAALGRWLTDLAEKKRASANAAGYIGAHRGAALRTAALLDPLLGST